MPSVLITGTNKGIGLATAVLLGRRGYTVHATMRDLNSSRDLTETAAKDRLPIHLSAMDVNSDESVKEAVGSIVSKYGPIDILINNAGIARRGSIEELPVSEFRALMETNYLGAIR